MASDYLVAKIDVSEHEANTVVFWEESGSVSHIGSVKGRIPVPEHSLFSLDPSRDHNQHIQMPPASKLIFASLRLMAASQPATATRFILMGITQMPIPSTFFNFPSCKSCHTRRLVGNVPRYWRVRVTVARTSHYS